MPLTRKRRLYRDRQSLRTLCPNWQPRGPIPPPPQPLHVAEVRVSSGDPFRCIWTFDQDINNPTGEVAAFRVGQPGRFWTRVASNALAIDYFETVEGGVLWDVTAAAGGLTSIDGMPLEAGTGVVLE